MRSVRIAFLTVGDLGPAVVEKYGKYIDLFTSLYKLSHPQHADDQVSVTLDDWDVRNGVWPTPEDMRNYQAILIPGSAACAFDDSLPWLAPLFSFIRDTFENRPHIKIIGFCFGHQAIARALGGECTQNEKGWEIGVADVRLTEAGQRLFGRDTLRVQQMHRDHVPAVPTTHPFQLLGYTDIAPVQGLVLYHPSSTDIHILTLQGHPEFSIGTDIVTTITNDRETKGIFNKKLADTGRRQAAMESDGVTVVGRFLWKMLGIEAA